MMAKFFIASSSSPPPRRLLLLLAIVFLACGHFRLHDDDDDSIIIPTIQAFIIQQQPASSSRQQHHLHPHRHIIINGPLSLPLYHFSREEQKESRPAAWSSSRSSSSSSSSTTTALFGIPKMFRWLTDQYPDILNRQLESNGLDENLIVDNLYLDMNGIIHPCTHGDNNDSAERAIILDETAMFKKIFLYVDRLYKLVRPRTVLYLAVDGVAPRAKMNQQRSRRFRAAKEMEAAALERAARGENHPINKNVVPFDSNCITPGTDFMLKLSLALQKWVQYKLDTDPIWQTGADVIVSGPDVPGEGEHKVMDFIRAERTKASSPYYRPNMVHVLYGLDADLVMLGLVTHESNFMLLREKMSVVMGGRRKNNWGSRPQKKKDMLEYSHNDYELLELGLLRQMLQLQFAPLAEAPKGGGGGGEMRLFDGAPLSLDRIIDDFVFMCMLVGNDFLPHVPHLEIDRGALSMLMNTYVDLLGGAGVGSGNDRADAKNNGWQGYLTDKAYIHPQRFEQFVYHLAAYEEQHFQHRAQEDREPGWALSTNDETDPEDFYGKWYGGAPTPPAARAKTVPSEQVLRPMAPSANVKFRRAHPESLYCRSYRDFYYESKFNWSVQARDATLWRRRQHVRDYLHGLHWNLYYYHQGCASWDWFFPYLYAPLATDMVNLDELYDNDHGGDPTTPAAVLREDGFATIQLEQGTPFPSLAQLLSVLPPQSASLLPKPLGALMTDPSSPLAPYYPMDFETDANGKRQSWEAIVKIPFIDADIMLENVSKVVDHPDAASTSSSSPYLLSPSERRRNAPGRDHIFVAPARATGGGRSSEEEGLATTGAPTTTTQPRNSRRSSTGPSRSKTTTTTPQQQRFGRKLNGETTTTTKPTTKQPRARPATTMAKKSTAAPAAAAESIIVTETTTSARST